MLAFLMLRALVLAAAALSAGWDYVEHLSIGNESYRRACERLRKELVPAASTTPPGSTATSAAAVTTTATSTKDPGIATRLGIACDNLDIAAQLYGQATALAGDRFGGPADFLSTRAGWKVASRREYYSLALANTTHFHPYATREWWRYHRTAVLHAIEASKKQGLDSVDGLQSALFEAAFADHFLQDAFSSGHMGFNRAASSVAASLVYHDKWNGKGRVVRDRAGRSWRTYGDGHLDSVPNKDGRLRVVEVAELSVEGVLRAFVLGVRNPDHELQIWRALPYVIEAPELKSLTDRILDIDEQEKSPLHPLEAINWPARKDRVVNIETIVAVTKSGDSPIIAMLAGYHVSLPLVSTPIHVGVGMTIPHGPRDLHFAGAADLTAPLGLTNDGLLEHHLVVGALWEADYKSVAGSIWAGYKVNFEVGRNLIQFQIGPSFVAPERELGVTAGLGFARVLSAAGGGAR